MQKLDNNCDDDCIITNFIVGDNSSKKLESDEDIIIIKEVKDGIKLNNYTSSSSYKANQSNRTNRISRKNSRRTIVGQIPAKCIPNSHSEVRQRKLSHDEYEMSVIECDLRNNNKSTREIKRHSSITTRIQTKSQSIICFNQNKSPTSIKSKLNEFKSSLDDEIEIIEVLSPPSSLNKSIEENTQPPNPTNISKVSSSTTTSYIQDIQETSVIIEEKDQSSVHIASNDSFSATITDFQELETANDKQINHTDTTPLPNIQSQNTPSVIEDNDQSSLAQTATNDSISTKDDQTQETIIHNVDKNLPKLTCNENISTTIKRALSVREYLFLHGQFRESYKTHKTFEYNASNDEDEDEIFYFSLNYTDSKMLCYLKLTISQLNLIHSNGIKLDNLFNLFETLHEIFIKDEKVNLNELNFLLMDILAMIKQSSYIPSIYDSSARNFIADNVGISNGTWLKLINRLDNILLMTNETFESADIMQTNAILLEIANCVLEKFASSVLTFKLNTAYFLNSYLRDNFIVHDSFFDTILQQFEKLIIKNLSKKSVASSFISGNKFKFMKICHLYLELIMYSVLFLSNQDKVIFRVKELVANFEIIYNKLKNEVKNNAAAAVDEEYADESCYFFLFIILNQIPEIQFKLCEQLLVQNVKKEKATNRKSSLFVKNNDLILKKFEPFWKEKIISDFNFNESLYLLNLYISSFLKLKPDFKENAFLLRLTDCYESTTDISESMCKLISSIKDSITNVTNKQISDSLSFILLKDTCFFIEQ